MYPPSAVTPQSCFLFPVLIVSFPDLSVLFKFYHIARWRLSETNQPYNPAITLQQVSGRDSVS
ncbi:hypothetical protein TMatcc_010216 [Talaromyces marneffei ATCC 18224]